MTYNKHVQNHSILTIYSGLSISFSRYDLQHAFTVTADTDNTFGPLLSLSLIMTYNMHVQKYSILTIYSGISLSLAPSRYDEQHACAETIDTDNTFGPPSLSHYDVQHALTETLDPDNIFGSLSLSLVMTYNMHVQKYLTQTLYSVLSLSFSLSL